MTETSAERAEQKLRFLNEAVGKLEAYQKMSREEYDSDPRNELVVERLFQTALEGVIDTARLIIIDRELEKPSDARSEFSILADAAIISVDLSQRLTQAKGFRNVLVHEYVSIEKDQVYRNLQEDLSDLKEFGKIAADYILKNES